VCFVIIENGVTWRIVHGMFFLGRNFVSNLLNLETYKKPLKPFKNPFKSFKSL